jgi:hypothetical protein
MKKPRQIECCERQRTEAFAIKAEDLRMAIIRAPVHPN